MATRCVQRTLALKCRFTRLTLGGGDQSTKFNIKANLKLQRLHLQYFMYTHLHGDGQVTIFAYINKPCKLVHCTSKHVK